MIGSRPAMQKHTMKWDDLRVFLAVARHSRLQTAGRTLGLDPTTATDVLWSLNHPDMWILLVDQRGWTPAAFESWFADTLCQQLLRP